ncbi:Six-hairpin glycosidase [Rhodotorula sp. JG-1b]|nr:Six-hairpin glycosidase [Rhodotorula sp. JG-1b]
MLGRRTLSSAAVASLVAPSIVLAAPEPNITSRLQPLFDPNVLQKVRATAETAPATSVPQSWPEYTSGSANAWVFQPATDWTSAFFPDELYALDRRYSLLCPNDATQANGTDWREAARTWSAGLYNPAATVLASWGHDVGFNSAPMIAELALDSSNETARQALVSNAETLASLFSPVVGCTRSWDRGPDNFEVIIDNMMNLPLLLSASDLTGNATYRTMAESHANKTIENHIRSDGGSFHVVNYLPSTGEVQWRGTAQGYSNSSTWSRGQAWGILGFALLYNATGVPVYLETSERMATYFYDHLNSSTGIAPWDFDAPAPLTFDTSASAIAASAMLVLSSLEASRGNTTGSDFWAQAGQTLLVNTANVGLYGLEDGQTWIGDSILGYATVNNRADPPNNSTGAIYGDSYFVHAGNYLLSLGLVNCLSGSPAAGASRTGLSSNLVTVTTSTQKPTSSSAGSSAGLAAASASSTHTSRAFRLELLTGLCGLTIVCASLLVA